MGNNNPWQYSKQIETSSQQVRNHSNDRSPSGRIGLMPTDGYDAYKRPSSRSSRRSRPERASYLMATGHLDIEETHQLNNSSSPAINDGSLGQGSTNSSLSPLNVPRNDKALSGDQAFLNYVSSANNFGYNDKILSHNSFKTKTHKSKVNNHNKGKFRQTYTEVTGPMEPSPAFEYFIKDNKRRSHRRCCLWLLYSTLMTICIAIIVFCCVHLYLRFWR